MKDYEQKVLDAITNEFKQTKKPVKIRKMAKGVGLSEDLAIDICKRLKANGYIEYYNVADRTAPKNEYVCPTPQALR